MARYDISRAWFQTPRGRSVVMHVREGTNDWNTCQASLTQDEYGLRDLKLTGIALDIGGYLGSVAIGMLIDNAGLLRVDVVEPLPENVDLIRRNAEVNGVADRLLVHEAGAGDGRPVTIHYAYEGGENELHHAFVGNAAVSNAGLAHKSVTVPTLTPYDFGVCSFVKIDAEGAEWGFFGAGGAHRFARIVGEWHPVNGGSQERLSLLLGPTHTLTFSGPEGGPGGFTAIRND